MNPAVVVLLVLWTNGGLGRVESTHRDEAACRRRVQEIALTAGPGRDMACLAGFHDAGGPPVGRLMKVDP